MTVSRNVLVLALAVALPLADRATVRASGARTTGQLLTDAGFQAAPADTPRERARDERAAAGYWEMWSPWWWR